MSEIEFPEEQNEMAMRKYYREIMKKFNITKKYFKSIYAYVWCEICFRIIPVEINKEDIRKGVQKGLYIHNHTHTNPNKDIEDPEDKSDQEHTVMIFIDSRYNVRNVRTYFGKTFNSGRLTTGSRIPVITKEIRPGTVPLEEYEILLLCNGDFTVEDVSEIAGIPLKSLEDLLIKFKEKGLVNIIKRV